MGVPQLGWSLQRGGGRRLPLGLPRPEVRSATKQPRGAGRGDAKVTLERLTGPRGVPALTNSPYPRGQRRRTHAPRRPSAAPSLEKSGSGYLGSCAYRKRASAREGLGEKNLFAVFHHPLRHSPWLGCPHGRLPAGLPPPPAGPTPGRDPGVSSKGGMGLASTSPWGFTFWIAAGVISPLPRCLGAANATDMLPPSPLSASPKRTGWTANGGKRRRPLGLNHLGNAGGGMLQANHQEAVLA